MSDMEGFEPDPKPKKQQKRERRQAERDAADSQPLIAFVHIPKTAGGTLKTVMSDVFGKDAVHDAGNYMRNPERTATQTFDFKRDPRITIGHVHLGLFRQHLPADTRYITFLREPVDRVISHYYRHLDGKGPSLHELLESGMPQLTNLMTRFLCGHIEILGDLPNMALGDAKANLEHFTFVGVQERFDESLLLLQETLGLPKLAYGASRHVNEDRPSLEEVGEDERAFIAAHNQLDVELYRWARARFDALIDVRGDDLGAQVETLRHESAAKASYQAERTELAREWLTSVLSPGSSLTQDELLEKAEPAGFSLTELKRATRNFKALRRNTSQPGVPWEMRSDVEDGKRQAKRRRRAEALGTRPASVIDDAQAAALKAERKRLRREEVARRRADEPHVDAPPIAFVHIPKTAGGTLKSVFSDAFGRDAIHNAGNYLLNPEQTAEKARKLGPRTRFTLGHVPYGLFRPHLPAETRYITFLREPVERVISHWFRHLDGKTHGTLPEALKSGLPAVTNLMTRFLCGRADVLGQLPDSAVTEAKACLQSFVFVGFQERFDESLLLLQERLGMPMTAYGASIHVNAERPSEEQVGEETVALIEKHNQMDIELYTWAREHFRRDFEREELSRSVETLRGAVTEKAADQEERTVRALAWLTERVPPGTEQPFELLKVEAAGIGLSIRDLQQARRRMNPPSRKVQSDRGVMLVVAAEPRRVKA